MRRTEKNGTVDSVRRTYKLCCYRNTPNRSHAIFAWHESTLDVHPKNSFMVSYLTTGNSGQLKMSPKIPSVAKWRFWIWPTFRCFYEQLSCGLIHEKKKKEEKKRKVLFLVNVIRFLIVHFLSLFLEGRQLRWKDHLYNLSLCLCRCMYRCRFLVNIKGKPSFL